MAALKFIRSIRQWCYQIYNNERRVKLVVMATSEDIECHAEYARLADEIIKVPSGPSHQNYGNVELIVELAQEHPVQAVWAGWGHASEDPRLPNLLAKCSIIFLGPTSEAMWLLGDKIASTLIAQSLGIPCLPWSGSGVALPKTSNPFTTIPSELYEKCTLNDADAVSQCVSQIGFPLMLKASCGGGGKGIRKLTEQTDYSRVLKQIVAEVPDSPIFAVSALDNARHVEIQLIGDCAGEVVTLFSRDCSVQRRHQKIVEEAPAIVCPSYVLSAMELDAVKIAKSVGYVGTGTVEYLFDLSTNQYFFLELNPRLQVEHPCTEIIANLNLPGCQLEVALGRPLLQIKDLQPFVSHQLFVSDDKLTPHPISPIPRGHVIAARITAESAEEGFTPSSGCVSQLNFRSRRHTWGYFSVNTGGKLHKYADSQFGHLFSWGNTRDEARKGMIVALKELSVHGEVRTIISFLINLLEHPLFISNNFFTAWLDSSLSHELFFTRLNQKVIVACGASCIAYQHMQQKFDNYKESLKKGHVPKCAQLVETVPVEFIYHNHKFKLDVSQCSSNSFFITLNNSFLNVPFYPLSNNGLLLTIDNRSFSCFLHEDQMQYVLEVDTAGVFLLKDMDPSTLRAPSAGKLLSLLYKDGDFVSKGSDFAEIEVMKMVISLSTNKSGKIYYNKPAGTIVEAGTIIAHLELNEDSHSTNVYPYNGDFETLNDTPKSKNSSADSSISDLNYLNSFKSLEISIAARKAYKQSFHNLLDILSGYALPESHFLFLIERDLSNVTEYISQVSFVFFQLRFALLKVKVHFPSHIFTTITHLLNQYKTNISSVICELPTIEILSTIEAHASVLIDVKQRNDFYENISEFYNLVKQLNEGPKAYKLSILISFLEKYLDIEDHFATCSFEASVQNLLSKINNSTNEQKSDLTYFNVLRIIASHANLPQKNILVSKLIDVISQHFRFVDGSMSHIKLIMTKLSNLPSNHHLKVALRAKQFLISSQRPSFELRHNQLESIMLSLISGFEHDSKKILREVVHSDGVILDILPNFFFSSNPQIQAVALELYVRRVNFSSKLFQLTHRRVLDLPIITYICTSKGSMSRVSSYQSSECQQTNTDHENHCPLNFHTLSLTHKSNLLVNSLTFKSKQGVLLCFLSFESLKQNFVSVLQDLISNQAPRFVNDEEFFRQSKSNLRITIITIAIKDKGATRSKQEEFSETCLHFLFDNREFLVQNLIKQVTFLISNCRGELPLFYTYNLKSTFREEKLFRHIDPSEGYLLELKRLCNFDLENIPCENPNIYIYFGKAKKKLPNTKLPDERFFIRTIIRNPGLISVGASFEYLVKASEIRLLEVLDQLAIITSNHDHQSTCNHIFFNFTPCIIIDPKKTVDCIRMIIIRHRQRLTKLKITHAEMKMVVFLEENSDPIPLRLVACNSSGYNLSLDLYKEITSDNGKLVYQSFDINDSGPLSGQYVDVPYPCFDAIDSRRLYAHSIGTSYVYDYPQLFNQALSLISRSGQHSSYIKQPLTAHFSEMIFDFETNKLVFIERPFAQNTVGVICWQVRIQVNDSISDVIVIANDITFSNGSVTPPESMVFEAACSYAIQNNFPLIFLCCCNGAQIGLDIETRDAFKVKWINDNNKDQGFEYLYLEEEDYVKLCEKNAIEANAISINGKIIYKITDIYGSKTGIGVENLHASGLMAGKMCRCYNEIFTISMVTGRAVGIGAYLVRLGRRVVQVDKSSIILTGYEALNNVLGKKVYFSHEQLGGVDIMNANGVSQLVAKDDLMGLRKVLNWLMYHIFSINTNPSSLMIDLPNSDVKTTSETEIDPRNLVYGVTNSNSEFVQGFFDKNSQMEINNGWASTVITGRARLCGIPVAYILNDSKTLKVTEPADPAEPDDSPKDHLEIGPVLSPQGSHKFAQSIQDANNEKLPLFIFSNFRGFSAGMKHMYNEVLKFGAMIVEAIKDCKCPIFVYILPHGELRGGSWAVLETMINPDYVEIYSSETSSANVLEPVGTTSIKFRIHDLKKTISRLENHSLLTMKDCSSTDNSTQNETIIFNDDLIKCYQNVVNHFASLHDTPRRMLRMGVIKKIVPWAETRSFFYWRLRRRINEQIIFDKFSIKCPEINFKTVKNCIESWFEKANHGESYECQDDQKAVDWLEKVLLNDVITFEQLLKPFFQEYSIEKVVKIAVNEPKFIIDVIDSLAQVLSSDDREKLISKFNK